MENALFNWTMINMPTIAVCMALMWFTAWITTRLLAYRNRLSKVETDTRILKKSVRRLDDRVDRLERTMVEKFTYLDHRIDNLELRFNVLEQKVETIDFKLDKLITHLIAPKALELKD